MTEVPSEDQVTDATKADAHDMSDIRESAFSGALWTAGVRWGTLFITWPATIILARLLTPEDFGYIALVSVFTRFAVLVAEGGISNAIVMGAPLTNRLYQSLHGWSISFFAVTFLVLSLLAVPIEVFYDSPGARWLVIVLACGGLIEGLCVVPVSRMKRKLQFRELAMIHATMVTIEAIASVSFALLGFGYWSLALGFVVGRLTYGVIVLRFALMRPSVPRLEGLRETLANARRLLVAQISTFIAESSDVWVGGYAVGTRALGGYSFMSGLARAPVEKLSGIIMYVSAAAMGNIRDDSERLARATLRMISVSALLMFPVFAGLVLIANDLVFSLLGPKWLPYVPALQVFCIYAATTPIKAIMSQGATAAGAARDVAAAGIMLLVLLPISFLTLGTAYGATGIAAAWLVPLPLVFFRLMNALTRDLGISWLSMILSTWRATASVAIMAAGIAIGTDLLMLNEVAPVVSLVAKILLGMSLYAVATLFLQKNDTIWLISLVETKFPRQVRPFKKLLGMRE